MTECDLVHSTLQLNRYIERSFNPTDREAGWRRRARKGGEKDAFRFGEWDEAYKKEETYEKEATEEKRGGGLRAYEKGDLREGRAMSRRSFQADGSWYDCGCLRRTFKPALAYA
jgi:hypothetical protein